jgi:hypothetical protein
MARNSIAKGELNDIDTARMTSLVQEEHGNFSVNLGDKVHDSLPVFSKAFAAP